jgi:hypothetical protein
MEGAGQRALGANSYGAGTMTLESCSSFWPGHRYFEVEYSRECYCGDTFAPGSVPAPESGCNMPCAANSTEFCGAGDQLSVYVLAWGLFRDRLGCGPVFNGLDETG